MDSGFRYQPTECKLSQYLFSAYIPPLFGNYVPRFATVIFALSTLLTATVLAGRGDLLLPQVQFEQIRSRIISLQENVDLDSGRAYYTRSTYHRPAADNAARIIADTFSRFPHLQVRLEQFSGMCNVVADLPARSSSASQRIFIVCAHYDSTANRDADWHPLLSKAPGADDNATGVSCMLEIARILSSYEYDHHLRFVAFDAEEIGLVGSRHHVQQAIQKGEDIVSVVNLNMIGYNWKANLIQIGIDGASNWLAKAFQICNQWYDLDLTVEVLEDPSFTDSDHQPFWEAGYPAVTLIENTSPGRHSKNYDANPFIRTAQDTVDKVNLRLVTKVTQLAVVTIDSLLSRTFNAATDLSASQPNRFYFSLDPLNQQQINPVEVTGKISTPFPIQIVISPGNVVAKLIRNHRTDLVLPTTDLFELAYSAQVRLKPGQNVLQIAVIDPLSVTTMEREVYFKPNFDFQELKIYPNPVPRGRYQVTFQTEANQPLDDIHYSIYAVSGRMIRQLEGVVDTTHPQVGYGWWNCRIAYGNDVATGVYICRADVQVGNTIYSISERFVVLQ